MATLMGKMVIIHWAEVFRTEFLRDTQMEHGLPWCNQTRRLQVTYKSRL